MKKKVPDYGKVHWRPVQRLLKYPAIAVITHWIFQSLFYMDPTERWFKLGLDLGLTAVFTFALTPILTITPALLAAFVLAHTINFLFNGQLWGVLKQYGYVNISYGEFQKYVDQLGERARKEPAIKSLLIYGSVVREEWNSTSDLDGRILRNQGLLNGLRACWFLLLERSRALFFGFPIDVYIIDHPQSIQKLRQDEIGIDLIYQSI